MIPDNFRELPLEEAKKVAIAAEVHEKALIAKRDEEGISMEAYLAARDELKAHQAKAKELAEMIAAVEVSDEEETSAEETPVEEPKEEEEVEDEATEEAPEKVEAVAEVEKEVEAPKAEAVKTVEAVAEVEVTPETVAEIEEAVAVVEEIKPLEAVAASLTTGDIVDNINEPSETTAPVVTHLAASFVTVVDGAKDELEAINKVKARPAGGEAFKTVYTGEAVVNLESMNAGSMTDYVMALGTPGREGEMSRSQKQWALNQKGVTGDVAAALCQPPQLLNSDLACGSYNPVIFNSLPSFVMANDALELETYVSVDSSDEDFVGEVPLYSSSGDPLDSIAEKPCYELECLTRVQWPVSEVKACLTANEQTAFTNPRGVQALLSDGKALLAAQRDQILLDWIIDQTFKFSYAAGTAGYAELTSAITQTIEDLDRQSTITQVDDLVAYIPKSLLHYAVADNALRQFSLSDAQAAADGLFHGIGVRDYVVYDDALDSTNGTAVPTLSKTVATALTPATARDDWSIHLINPADAFVGLRNENEYALQPVAQSIAEKRANELAWFARNYFTPGRRGCEGWATISVTNLCLGGRVVAAASCMGV